MVIDLRQHIITLVAVFLALAIGILVGSSFIAGSSIERQVAKGLEREFGKIRAVNAQQEQTIGDLQARMKKNALFDRAVAPVVVSGQLVGKRVAIVQSGDFDEATKDTKSIIERAGGLVTSVTTIPHPSDTSESDARRALLGLTGDANPENPVERCFQVLAFAIASGLNPDAVRTLEADGLITSSGDYDKHVSCVVIVGGCKDEASDVSAIVDKVLVEKLKTLSSIPVVGVEPLGAVTSFIPTYQRMGIASVDNIDESMGQVALVFALAGDGGSFGVKRTADRAVPDSVENMTAHSPTR